MSDLVESILSALRDVWGSDPAALHEPSFGGNEWLYLKECLDSTFVSSVGNFVTRFESQIAEFTGAKNVLAVVNGTSALHLALKIAGIKEGDEVLVPALTFVATANAVSYCGAIPHFVDSEQSTLGIDPKKLRDYLSDRTERHCGYCVNRETGRAIRGLVPMHTFGHPVDIEGMLSIARDYNLVLIEDAAESLGSKYYGKHTGTFGSIGTLSFNGNKIITTGGGGALLVNDESLFLRAKHLSTTSKVQHPWEYRHDEIGYNYRLPNINAALGCAQLEKISSMLVSKRELFKRYEAAFASIDGVKLITEPLGCESNYWLQTLLLDQTVAHERNEILTTTNNNSYGTRPVWVPLHKLTPYINSPHMDLSCTESLAERLINIPSSSRLFSFAK